MVLHKDFYEREVSEVAKDLLGNILVRRLSNELMGGIIVETEAYYGVDDPASRAYHGRKKYNNVMWGEAGYLFIYNVHRYWMLNFIAHPPRKVGGVLIRAIEPTLGLERMLRNRPVKNLRELTSGPGKLSVAIRIEKSLNGLSVTGSDHPVYVIKNEMDFELEVSHRIGVTRDLHEQLRFYIKGNRFVSR